MRPESVFVLYRYRGVLRAMVTQALRDRVAGSVFGFLFIAIYPLIFLAVYSAVFIFILQVRVPDMSAGMYSIVIFCGLVPFLAFAEAFSSGTSSVTSNAGLVRNIMFPYQLLPAKDVLTSYLAMAAGFIMVLVAAIWSSGPHPTQLLLPVIFSSQVIFTIGLVWITSTVSVFFRDIQKLMPIITLFLMMISPIAYTREMLPPQLAPILSANPLSAFIYAYRDVLLFHKIPGNEIIIIMIITPAIYILGYTLTKRLRPLVFDYV
jgi:lipopolysaccharide transport system permease protein